MNDKNVVGGILQDTGLTVDNIQACVVLFLMTTGNIVSCRKTFVGNSKSCGKQKRAVSISA
jgi:hypothetical protein